MRSLKFLLLLPLTLWVAKPVSAQDDPTSWKYEIKKKSGMEYQLIFHLTLKPGYHIWSLHPGGDGYEISPSFTFDKNDQLKLNGEATEKGKATTTTMDGIDGKITYLNGKIDYVQNVTVKTPTKITGKHQYQVCNDKMCLPPKDKDFSFDIK